MGWILPKQPCRLPSHIKGRTAVIAKGCDSRAIGELIKENQIARERLVIIGVPCEGMVIGP